jgi:hypothetical protein
METTQGISLFSYLYLKLAKILYFSNYVLRFFFYKVGEQEGRTNSAPGVVREVVWHQWEGTGGRERGRRMNIVQIMCTHVINAKMVPVETLLGLGGEGNEREQWKG